MQKNILQESNIISADWTLFEDSAIWKDVFGRKKTEEARRQELQNKCHGEQNEGFFADKVILVEGNTEIYALPIYLDKAGFDLDRENISLIQVQGVDALLAVYAIFTAFKIPVYVIFDGDKPDPVCLNFYRHIQKCGMPTYLNFVKALGEYLMDNTSPNLNKARQLMKKLSDLLPVELISQLSSEIPDIAIIKSLYESKLMSAQKLDQVNNTCKRDRKLQSIFGKPNEQGFGPTTVQSRFTMWEYNFEESISKGLSNYAELYSQASQACSGKPLIAKLIASKAILDDSNADLKELLLNMFEKLRTITCAAPFPCNTSSKITSSINPFVIHLSSTSGEGSLKVFLCAGGPLNPLADDPISFAVGNFPLTTAYVIKISGNSMEPDIPDGSYVAVMEKVSEPPINQPCVFCLNGDSICKQYTKGRDNVVRLISRNPQYPPIQIHDSDRLDSYGAVICGKNKKPYILDVE